MDRSEPGLIEAAAAVLGTGAVVQAAGIFELDPGTLKQIEGLALGQAPGELLGGTVGAIVSGIGAFEGMKVADKAGAADEGVTPLVLVAISADSIHILDWSMKAGTSRALLTFPRSTTDVHVTKVALSRHVTFKPESGQEIKVWGTTASFGKDGEGDKAVVDLLQS